MPIVVNPFRELEHDDHNYALGDFYPAEGFEVSAERVEFLSKPHPKYKTIFLYEEVKEIEKETEIETETKLEQQTPAPEGNSAQEVVKVEVAPDPQPKKPSPKKKKDGE